MIKPSFLCAYIFHLLCITLLIHRFCKGNIRVSDFTRLMTKDYSVPKEFIWLTVPQQTMYQCSQFCYSFQICKSFTFVREEDICKLSLSTTGELGMFNTEKRHDYLERKDISKELVGKCWDHNCGAYSKCSEINGHATCVKVFEDHTCGYPFPVTFANTTLDSPVLPGTMVNIQCTPPYDGEIKLVCNIDGNWTHYIYPGNYCYADFCDILFIRQTKENHMFITTPDRRLFFTKVACELGDGGRDWLVLQKRFNISFDFDKDLGYYEYGFEDDHKADFWTGLYTLHVLSDYNDLDLTVEFMVENDPTLYHAMYERFHVGTNTTDFVLTVGQYIGGNCGDGLSYMDGFTFNVTMDGRGGWWNRDGCNGTNLNAEYNSPALKWTTGCQADKSSVWTDILSTKMKIRREKV